MREVIPNAPVAGNKTRAGLSKEESVRFFGPPPLITGEDQAQYEAMRDQISAAVGPLDFLEEIWVNDVVNLVWETLRLRRRFSIETCASASQNGLLRRRTRPVLASS
jgi:hypothetical protein